MCTAGVLYSATYCRVRLEVDITLCDHSDAYVVAERTSNTADHDVVTGASVGTACGTETRILHSTGFDQT